MGRVDGKVAFITGVARGQGRAHALRLAEEGADIVGLDLCEDVPTIPIALATSDDLEETRQLIETVGRRAILRKGDVRNPADIEAVVQEGLSTLGHIDAVVANAGVAWFTPSWEITEEAWSTVIDINLTGAWRTAKAAIPSMIDAARGGSIMFTSSAAALGANGYLAHYAASKTALMGLCREMALELGPYGIRVNTIHPTAVGTPMMDNETVARFFNPDGPELSVNDQRLATQDILRQSHLLPVGWIRPEDVSNAVLFLASDESCMVTGTPFRVDAGFGAR
jgi:(+)-trans-carveol dehydrogenase